MRSGRTNHLSLPPESCGNLNRRIPTGNESKLEWFTLLAAPFILNDIAYIFVRDYRVWFAIDYLFVKAFPLVIIVYILRTGKATTGDLGIKMPSLSQLATWTIFMAAFGIAIDQVGWRFFAKILPPAGIRGYPQIPVPWLATIDLYFGLLCAGFFEEVIFRGLAFTACRARLESTPAVFLITAVLFGLAHWSTGLHAIITTGIIGALFMIVMWRTGSVVPAILAHFLVNYVSYSGMIPYNSPWFDFLK